MSTQNNQKLIKVISSLYNHPIKALNLLEDIGLETYRVKAPFSNLSPSDYWQDTIREIRGGMIDGGITKLLSIALRDFPRNEELKSLKHHNDVLSTPSLPYQQIPKSFDVFLAYNSYEFDSVNYVAECLRSEGLNPWFDKWCMLSGKQVYTTIEQGLQHSKAIAIFVGVTGKGKWQNLEIGAAIDLFVDEGKPIIPIWLMGRKKENAPLLIRQYTGFKFNSKFDQDMIAEFIHFLRFKNT